MNTHLAAKQKRLTRIEDSIERNREMIAQGGDKDYYSKQILHLNSLASDLEKEIELYNNRTISAYDLKVGDLVETQEMNPNSGKMEWNTYPITRCTEHFLWFKGTGYCRIKRSTVDEGIFYRIVNN